MKKKRIVYSLTGRGLFSELSNLALALVYADYNQEELTVNTRNWNARVEKGWSDYFESVLPNCNGVMCSQYIVYKKGKPWWGNIYYNPSAFFRYYIFYIMNRIYLLFHPETELGNEVFLKMRSEDFLEKLEDIRNDYGSALRKILKFNEKTTGYIEKRKSEMNLPVDYIAVHIRRGDKIVSREMKELGLSLYIDAVKGKKHISRNVFIATDDGSVTDKLKSVLVAFLHKKRPGLSHLFQCTERPSTVPPVPDGKIFGSGRFLLLEQCRRRHRNRRLLPDRTRQYGHRSHPDRQRGQYFTKRSPDRIRSQLPGYHSRHHRTRYHHFSYPHRRTYHHRSQRDCTARNHHRQTLFYRCRVCGYPKHTRLLCHGRKSRTHYQTL